MAVCVPCAGEVSHDHEPEENVTHNTGNSWKRCVSLPMGKTLYNYRDYTRPDKLPKQRTFLVYTLYLNSGINSSLYPYKP